MADCIVKGAGDAVRQFNCEASPRDSIGMNSELRTKYIEFVADCIVKGAVEAVRQFNCEASPCDSIGINRELMTKCIEFGADCIVQAGWLGAARLGVVCAWCGWRFSVEGPAGRRMARRGAANVPFAGESCFDPSHAEPGLEEPC